MPLRLAPAFGSPDREEWYLDRKLAKDARLLNGQYRSPDSKPRTIAQLIKHEDQLVTSGRIT